MTLTLSMQFRLALHREALPRRSVLRWLRKALPGDATITVRVVDAPEGLALNRDYRQQNHPTNVLTFVYETGPTVVADLVLCAPVVAAEAEAQHKPLQAHYAHLIVHGALHAQGWDHEDDSSAEAMERQESLIMTALGFDDPYAEPR